MLPRYVLPARASERNINFETKPRQVEAWINRLPLSNPTKAAEEMADYLATLNIQELSHDSRARIVDLVAPVAEDLAASLFESHGGLQLPLPPKQQHNAALAQRLLRAMADSYKILLLDWLKRRFHLFGGDPTPLYLQRILLALQASMEISFEIHEPVPAGVWVDLHQTYNYALRNGLKDVIPQGGAKMQSLEQIYVATLLFALADPYHFPQLELPWAKDIIARFPAQDKIKTQAGLFVVDVNADSAPNPLARESHPMNPRWDLILDTNGLTKHLSLIATHIKGREDPEKIGLPDAARNPAYPSMLTRLRRNWGASVQRQSQRRRHQDGKEFEVCFGLSALHQLISPTARNDTIHYGLSSAALAPVIINCKTLNDSMGGLSLCKTGLAAMQIRVGDVVGVRQTSGTWSIGLVRWFRVPKQGEISFGTQLLAPHSLAIQLRRSDNGRQWPGLLLHLNAANPQSLMLVAQPGCFIPDINAEINTPKGNQLVRIDKRLESTPSVELFRFRIETPAFE